MAPWGCCCKRRRTIRYEEANLGNGGHPGVCVCRRRAATGQQRPGPPNAAAENVAAADFSDTSAAQANLLETDISESRSFTSATPAAPEAAPSPAAPAPKPNFIYGSRDDYRWQLALGVGFYRFQSNIINASLVGTNTTVSYFTNGWLAVEGNIVTGFAPSVNVNEHVKYFGGGGGIRVGGRRNRFEPWAHVLVGGAHLQPQTAGNSRSASCRTSRHWPRLPPARAVFRACRNRLGLHHLVQSNPEQFPGRSRRRLPLLIHLR